MTFRLPFQIFCNVFKQSKCLTKLLPSVELRSATQTRNFTSLRDLNNNELATCSTVKRNISLSHSNQAQNYIYDRSTNLKNRKKVRKLNKCYHPRKCVRKLAFRQTTREECQQCINPILVPVKNPGLPRLKPDYDASKLEKIHVCPKDICDDVQRMDDIRGYTVKCKKLPKLVSDKCEPCLAFKPTKAPKLVRLRKEYDPSLMKWNHPPCKDPCVAAARMDDILGYAVTPKSLPELPKAKQCMPCLNYPPKCAPKLRRPKRKYDASKMKWKHPPCAEPCEKVVRMDDICYKVKMKELPKLPQNDNCVQCLSPPKYAPKLKRPPRLFDPSELKWVHPPPCKDYCEVAAPRMDDVLGYKVKPKCLPKIISKCEPCIPPIPTKAPKLKRPVKKYDDSEMKWKHKCPEEGCDTQPERMDDIVGLKVIKKKLPKLPDVDNCTPCINVPTICPALARPQKLYDDLKLKWAWADSDCIKKCDNHPRRSDVLTGYKIIKKKLKKYVPSKTCKPCLAFLPTKAPRLRKPKMLYDPLKLEQNRKCPEDTCNIDPPRMDDVLKYTVKEKELPKLPKGGCLPCLNLPPKYAPELCRPKRRYDPSIMKWNHPPCPECCEDHPRRMDDVVGYMVAPKKLPDLPTIKDCKPCIQTPKYAPELKRPKRKYDPSSLDRPPIKCEDLCDLDPPRMDDVLCWKPKKKILPSFNSDDHCRHFSTLAGRRNRIVYPIRSYKYKILREKVRRYGKKSSKKSKKKSGKNKLGKTQCPKREHPIGKKGYCPKKKERCDVRPKCNPKDNCNKPPRDKCKKPSCSCKPKKPKLPPTCPAFKRLKYCKKRTRHICPEWEYKPCKKKEAPYGAYSDCFDAFYEDPPSECLNYNEFMLQPKNQKSVPIRTIEPPPPKIVHVDPEKERKCLAEKKPDPEPIPDELCNWKNPCHQFKVHPCKARARPHCEGEKEVCCKKLNAPYKSFSDKCPQFPEVEIDECRLVEKIFREQSVNYEKPKSEKECSDKVKGSGKVDRSVRCGTKVKDVNEDHTCEEIIIPTWASRRVKCKKTKLKRIGKSDKCKKPGTKSKEDKKCCDKKKKKPKPKSKCSNLPSSSKSASGRESKKGAMFGPSSFFEKSKQSRKSKSKSSLKCSKPDPCKEENTQEESCKDPKSVKKSNNPNPKCGAGSKKPKKSCDKKQKPPKTKFGGGSSGTKIMIGKSQPSIREPNTNPPVLKCSASDVPSLTTCNYIEATCIPQSSSKTMWEKICEYFQPRPDAPTLHECIQRELELKAHKAAAAAGLEIREPRCSYIKINVTNSMPIEIHAFDEARCPLSPPPCKYKSEVKVISTKIKKFYKVPKNLQKHKPSGSSIFVAKVPKESQIVTKERSNPAILTEKCIDADFARDISKTNLSEKSKQKLLESAIIHSMPENKITQKKASSCEMKTSKTCVTSNTKMKPSETAIIYNVPRNKIVQRKASSYEPTSNSGSKWQIRSTKSNISTIRTYSTSSKPELLAKKKSKSSKKKKSPCVSTYKKKKKSKKGKSKSGKKKKSSVCVSTSKKKSKKGKSKSDKKKKSSVCVSTYKKKSKKGKSKSDKKKKSSVCVSTYKKKSKKGKSKPGKKKRSPVCVSTYKKKSKKSESGKSKKKKGSRIKLVPPNCSKKGKKGKKDKSKSKKRRSKLPPPSCSKGKKDKSKKKKRKCKNPCTCSSYSTIFYRSKRRYGTYVSKNKYFSTYSRFLSPSYRKHNLTHTIMENRNIANNKPEISLEEPVSYFSQFSPYLRLNNNYIGRMYKLKLSKIGVQNKFMQDNSKEGPYTICHICKVVPRHETILNPLLRHVKIPVNSKFKKPCNENDKE